MNLKRQLKAIAWHTTYYSGAAKVGNYFTKHKGSLLCFHRVLPDQNISVVGNRGIEMRLSQFKRFIQQARDSKVALVSLEECLQRQSRNHQTGLYANIGFDDGYLDNFEVAYPLLKEAGIPFTIYVTTDFADGLADLWWYKLEHYIRTTDSAIHPRTQMRHQCRSFAAKESVFANFRQALMAMAQHERQEYWQNVDPDGKLPSHENLTKAHCLTWRHLKTLAQDPLVTIGAHTISHPKLAALDKADANREIHSGRLKLESQLGEPIRHFAYPFGDANSCGPREFLLAKEAGFKSAVTTQPGRLGPQTRGLLHNLPRLMVRDDLGFRGYWVQQSGITEFRRRSQLIPLTPTPANEGLLT